MDFKYWALLGKIFADHVYLEKESQPFGQYYYPFTKNIKEALKHLKPIERKILILRSGLFGNKQPKTLEEIAKIIERTKERVRQIEARAIRKLRHPIRKNIIYGIKNEKT